MQIIKPNDELNKMKELEIAKATIAKQQAIIDYIAMMADIDLPNEEVEHNV